MTCTQALLSLFLLSPCNDGGVGPEAVEAAVASPERPAEDVARDAARKPAEVLKFLGIEAGMAVLDVFAGGGYYTEILNSLVGEQGKVLAHNNSAYLDYVGPEIERRFAEDRLANSEQLIAEANDLTLADGSLDATLMILTYHDFLFGDEEYGWPDVDEAAFLETLCRAMKPGAVLGVADHVASGGGDANEVASTLHRVEPQRVVADITGACFDLEAESDILRNDTDDHTVSATSPEMHGKTDRFLLKFVRR